MIRKVYFIENAHFDTVAEKLTAIPCFIDREYVEMDCSEIGILCRTEDVAFVERVLAPFV